MISKVAMKTATTDLEKVFYCSRILYCYNKWRNATRNTTDWDSIDAFVISSYQAISIIWVLRSSKPPQLWYNYLHFLANNSDTYWICRDSAWPHNDMAIIVNKKFHGSTGLSLGNCKSSSTSTRLPNSDFLINTIRSHKFSHAHPERMTDVLQSLLFITLSSSQFSLHMFNCCILQWSAINKRSAYPINAICTSHYLSLQYFS